MKRLRPTEVDARRTAGRGGGVAELCRSGGKLDARLRVHMREEVKQLQRKIGITTVFVTHDQEEALTIADRIAVMKDGVLQQVDTPAALYTHPRTLFVADFIGTMNLLPARTSARLPPRLSPPEMRSNSRSPWTCPGKRGRRSHLLLPGPPGEAGTSPSSPWTSMTGPDRR